MSLPKILILNQTFNNHTGGGITLTNLFAGWPAEKLAVASEIKLSRGKINFEICRNYYQIGFRESKWIFPFRLIQRKYPSGRIVVKKSVNNGGERKIGLRHKIVTDYFSPFLEFTGLAHCISRKTLSSELIHWLKEYDPDIIYAQAQAYEDVLFCIKIQELLKKPLVYHTMDDWITEIKNRGLFKKFWYRKIDKDLRRLLGKATCLMAISDSMAKEYNIRYQKNFITFHNPVDLNFWGKYPKANYGLNSPVTILYAGRTGIGIQTSLRIIAEAIEILNRQNQKSIKFILQTKDVPEWISKFECIEHRGFVEYSELPRIFSEADILILPYDFSPRSIEYFKLSMPTKATEYMASGTPIIVFAPEETATVEYLKRNDCAMIVTEPGKELLSRAINELIENTPERKRIATNASILVSREHSTKVVRRRFENLLSSLYQENTDASDRY